MSLANYIVNRLQQFGYIKQILPSGYSYDFRITITTLNATSTYSISAFTINQDGTVTIVLGRVQYSTGLNSKTSIEIRVSYITPTGGINWYYEFQISSLSGFTHPQSIVITIRPGGVYPM